MQDHEAYLRSVTVGDPERLSGCIELAAYDAAWPALFSREQDRLRSAIGAGALAIEHVGSTAVPNLCAKPIIDMLLVVRDSSAEAAYVPAVEGAGYTLRIREPQWFQHRMLKGPDTPVNVHVFSAGCAEVERMLRFRDLLRSDEAARER